MDICFISPNILDDIDVMNMRKEFINAYCKFNGTCDLNLFDNYIEWLAHTINQANSYNRFTFLIKENMFLIGSLEIVLHNTNQPTTAHAILCIRPSFRRKGYSKLLGKQAIYRCALYGAKKEHITIEYNCKSSVHSNINF